ncbi:winged helix-turn-helix domain-containing protein [Motilimonas pumila]|uniref:winged helix-turn-helix domain-containing protein n=1 Tax=Motilimonas pumila TaxID=2303987 RepID=UPI001E62194B|nr:crosslink repair DNA glycosylase YcaQ family protein [Motilimonas pumila]
MNISPAQARKIALLSQGLCTSKPKGNAYQKTVHAMQNLGYVQIDTLSVVQRAHHHTLWTRNPDYHPHHLDQMLADGLVYEYWSHAASYLSMAHFRFSLPRKRAIQSGQQKHWFKKDEKLMASILDRIRIDGPLMAKDFASNVKKKTGWESKPTKQALETLYMQGDLMIAARKNFHKVYDLTERVLPSHVDTCVPSSSEHAQFLVTRYLADHGVGKLAEMVYLLKDVKPHVHTALNSLQEEGVISKVLVGNEPYYTTDAALALLDSRMKRRQVSILSPFDNLLIQRARAKQLFGFDYLLECYTPAAKRQYGYFCLPILWGEHLVGVLDCKAHKTQSVLEIISAYVQAPLIHHQEFGSALNKALMQFANFNNMTRCSAFDLQPYR